MRGPKQHSWNSFYRELYCLLALFLAVSSSSEDSNKLIKLKVHEAKTPSALFTDASGKIQIKLKLSAEEQSVDTLLKNSDCELVEQKRLTQEDLKQLKRYKLGETSRLDWAYKSMFCTLDTEGLDLNERAQLKNFLFPEERAIREEMSGLAGDISLPMGSVLGSSRSAFGVNTKVKGLGMNLKFGETEFSFVYGGVLRETVDGFIDPNSPTARENKALAELDNQDDRIQNNFLEDVEYGLIISRPIPDVVTPFKKTFRFIFSPLRKD